MENWHMRACKELIYMFAVLILFRAFCFHIFLLLGTADKLIFCFNFGITTCCIFSLSGIRYYQMFLNMWQWEILPVTIHSLYSFFQHCTTACIINTYVVLLTCSKICRGLFCAYDIQELHFCILTPGYWVAYWGRWWPKHRPGPSALPAPAWNTPKTHTKHLHVTENAYPTPVIY